MRKYQGVCLPNNLLELIDKNKEKLGFTSRADFVKQVVRKELERLK